MDATIEVPRKNTRASYLDNEMFASVKFAFKEMPAYPLHKTDVFHSSSEMFCQRILFNILRVIFILSYFFQ